jgi:hypothetical protein
MTLQAPLSGLRRLIATPAGHPAPVGPAEDAVAVARAAAAHAPERCELCAAPILSGHRHLVDVAARTLRCACRACALLFDRPAGVGVQYRLVPDRRWHLPGFVLSDVDWDALRIPVDTAFFFEDSAVARMVAFYPSPAGAVESTLDLSVWAGLAAANPVLGRLTADVEALLVHRTPAGRDHWLVPIDDCYALVGLIRTHWTGLAGGPAVWREIAEFFTGLRARARPLTIERRSGG